MAVLGHKHICCGSWLLWVMGITVVGRGNSLAVPCSSAMNGTTVVMNLGTWNSAPHQPTMNETTWEISGYTAWKLEFCSSSVYNQ